MASPNSTLYEYDSDEVILYDLLTEFNEIQEIVFERNKERMERIKTQNKDFADMVRHSTQKGKEVMKLYYKSSVLEGLLFAKMMDCDPEGTKEYEEKLNEVFVDLDMLLSEKMEQENDYKTLTDGIMDDKKYIDDLVKGNKYMWSLMRQTKKILRESFDINLEGDTWLSYDLTKGLLGLTH